MKLNTVYVLKDQLKRIWTYEHPAWARKALEQWCALADASGIPALAIVIAASACQDLPTTLERPTSLPALAAGGERVGQIPFYCTISKRNSAPGSEWQVSRFKLYVPRGELEDGGRTVLYQLRRPDESGFVRFNADCTVPYTEGAIRRVDRTFGVNGGAEQFAARRDMITVQVCDGKDGCLIAPIIVKAPLKPNVDPEDLCIKYPGECDSDSGGDTGSDGGGSGGADDGGADDTESGYSLPPREDDDRPDCEKDADKYCKTRPLTQKEWEDLGKVIDSLREDIEECRGAKQILQGFHAQGIEGGRFRFWDGADLNATRTRQRYGYVSGGGGERIINYDSRYAKEKGLVVHEGLHTYLNNINSPLMGQENEAWVDKMQAICEK